MYRVFILVLLTIVSVTWGQVEYQPITGELLEHWNTAYSSHLPKVYHYDSCNLPDGIYELHMAGIEVERDSLDIYLLGIAPETDIPFLLAIGGYRGDYNFTKSYASYDEDDDEICLSFQMPGSARWCTGCYRWNIEEESLEFLRYYTRDPSLEAMERVDSLLTEGNIEEAIDELNGMFYPGNYYSSDEMISRLLRSINRTAFEEQDGGNYQGAVDLFLDLADFLHTQAEWYTAFDDSLDYVESNYSNYMDLSEYVMIMNNYAFYLEQTNDLSKSLIVLRKVLDLDPSRMVGHLNVADVLWGLGETTDAQEHYSIYKEMMIDRELTDQIPLYVEERITPTSVRSVTSNYLFGDIYDYVIKDGVLFASILGDGSNPDYGSGILAMDIDTGKELWFYGTSDAHSWSNDTPWDLREKDGRIYALVNSSGLHCLDSGTGRLIHLVELSETVIAPYILTEDVLYVASKTEVIAFDLFTGETLWSFLDRAGPIGMHPTITNIYIDNGMLYIGSIIPNVRCLNAGNGELIWVSTGVMDSDGAGYANVAHVSSNLIFVSTASGELSLLDRSNGQVITYIEGCEVMAASEEIVYIYDFYSNQLKALDPESGIVTREFVPMEGMSLYSSQVVCCEEAISFGCRNGTLLLVPIGNILDGSWEFMVIDLADSPLQISCYEGTIITASKTGDIALVNANTFEVVWEIRTGIEITQPLQLYNGSLYFTSGSSFYTIQLDSQKDLEGRIPLNRSIPGVASSDRSPLP